jgi:N-acetylneuraminic acid mutarotase
VKKSTSQSASTPRTLTALLLCAGIACWVLTGASLAFLRSEAPTKVFKRTLTFAERVAYQRAIEEVYWRHRIWAKERPERKPSLDAVMSQAQLEKKVADYLRNSKALEDYWQRPITTEQLQAEVDRMAQHTKQPEVLRELFEALGNDPFLIAECLARPALAERLVTNWYAYDQRFHGELRQRAEADLGAHNAVEQMKQMSGKYSEIELVKSDRAHEEVSRGTEHDVNLNSREWDKTVQKLAAMFSKANNSSARTGSLSHAAVAIGSPAKGAPIAQIKTGMLSPLQEDEERYYATAVLTKANDRLKLATVAWLKEPLKSWLAKIENQMFRVMAATSASYTLPAVPDGANGCTPDTWAAVSLNVPDARVYHTAVWTGSEMIVWGGVDYLSTTYFNTGGRYNPSTDSWTATSTVNGPTGRYGHTAVWTGSEMIIWGGFDGSNELNTGSRYDPNTDSWTATSLTNAPSARDQHTAVWTGSEVIVWGGSDAVGGRFNTGGRYNPSTGSWIATSTLNAPGARYLQAAVWTGEEMIIWGGDGQNLPRLNTGGRYNPSTDSWAATTTTNVPAGRDAHTAVWTGSEMVVWGGDGDSGYLDTGGRYNPSMDG